MRRRLKDAARRVGGRPLASARRRRQRPVLSVVMPVYNVATYLPETLDSVLSQSFTELEVIAVDDGSTDACPQILEDYASRDYRVRVLRQGNAGQGAARNLGVERARGELLTFLDSDDVLPRDAYAAMVAGLRASGSDFSVGNLRRLRHGSLQRIIWSRTVHPQDRIATTIDEFPAAVQDIIACNRMFRTAFWREQVGGFRAGIAYEDHVPMLTAYVRARTFDVLQQVTYHWRIREDLTSTGQQKARIANLRDRIEVMEEARALLQDEASDGVYAAWVGRALEVDFPPFLPFALTGDEHYRSLLAQTYRTFLDRVTPSALAHVRVAMRVRAHLAALERWDDLFAADDWLREVQNLPPTVTRGGRLLADFPTSCTWADALPLDQREMAPLECHFEAAIEHLQWSLASLTITGWAWMRGLDMTSPVVGAELVSGTSRVSMTVRSLHLPEADVWSPLSFASASGGGFEATVDLDELRMNGPDSWRLEVTVTQDGITSSGPAHHRVVRSAAVAPSVGEGAGVRWSSASGLVVDVDAALTPQAAAGISAVSLDEDVLCLEGTSDLDLSTIRDSLITLPVPLSRDLAGRSPQRLLGRTHRIEVGQRPDGRAVVALSPPLRDDEIGPVNRQRLRSRYAVTDDPVTDAVLLIDSQPGLAERLAEHRLSTPLMWSVDDGLSAAPSGSVRVLAGSSEWYDALATCRLVVVDRDLGPWVRRRPGQRLLRTVDLPLDGIGVSAWRAQGMLEHLINRELHHRHQEWDVLLAPTPDAERLLREEFRWQGEVLVADDWGQVVEALLVTES